MGSALVLSCSGSAIAERSAAALQRCAASLPAGMFAHELLNDARIRKRGYVTQLVLLVGGDLTKYSPHDLSGASLWEPRRPLNHIGGRNRTDFLANPIPQFDAQWFTGFDSGDQRDVYVDALAFDVVWKSNDGGLCHLRMSHQGTFNFRST
jgi:hypothetical protein